MVFSVRLKLCKWSPDGHPIEQVRDFKYLGMIFQASRKRTAQQECVVGKALHTINALRQFYYTKGDNYIPAVLEVYRAKPLAQMMYKIPIWANRKLN